MLDEQTFKAVIKNTPLVSIDLCLVWDGQILLGLRANEPLQREWFTPGGRIHKNETWKEALLRIARIELGLKSVAVKDFALMGVWDHFYNNNAFDQNSSIHYVNLPHYVDFKSKPPIAIDDQHIEFEWFDLVAVYSDKNFHPYMRNYANWLLNKAG